MLSHDCPEDCPTAKAPKAKELNPKWDNGTIKMMKKHKIANMSETQLKSDINGPARVYTRARVHCPEESEKTLEKKLREQVKKRGGLALKLLSQLHRGLPDRIVLLPHGIIYFVELKSTGKSPTELQEHCHRQLRVLGFSVVVIASSEALTNFLTIVDFELAEIQSRRGK